MNKSKKLYLIHEFSEKVGVSKSTLRYYDKLGFFNRVIREDNCYRFFTEADFFIIQKIIALKAIGFELKDIKKILLKRIDQNNLRNNIFEQMKYMKKRIEELSFLYNSLENFLSINKVQSYENIIDSILKIIKDFTMVKNVKESWLKEILTPSSLEFVSKRKQISVEIIDEWKILIEEIMILIDKKINPMSEAGIVVAKKWMDIVKKMGTSDEEKLFGMEVWAAYKEGKIKEYQEKFPNEHFFLDIPQKVIFFIDTAISYMYYMSSKISK